MAKKNKDISANTKTTFDKPQEMQAFPRSVRRGETQQLCINCDVTVPVNSKPRNGFEGTALRIGKNVGNIPWENDLLRSVTAIKVSLVHTHKDKTKACSAPVRPSHRFNCLIATNRIMCINCNVLVCTSKRRRPEP